MNFGDVYSQYYDLLYRDKDYIGETSYVEQLIRSNRKNSSTLLDLGCGTGKHAELFCEKGYEVHGVDLSPEMLAIAESRRTGKESRLQFTCSNISELQLDAQFDVVTSLFHVMSYQTENSDLLLAFQKAYQHLNPGGLFIFDFWYGPGVLTDRPVTRVKRLENENISVTRISESEIHATRNVVDVHFDVLVENKIDNSMHKNKEKHAMRYFFDPELEMACQQVGFNVASKFQWMTDNAPSFSSWNVVWVVQK
jgi:SAM-dependent methyltransferase